MDIIKKSKNTDVEAGVEKRESSLLHYWWEYKLLEPPWETVCMFLKKLKIRVAT